MTQTTLAGAWLNKTNLTSSDLTSANLSGASLYAADLSGTNLQGADLRGVNFVGADLSGADLRGANLDGGIFRVQDFVNTEMIDNDGVITALNQAAQAALAQDANLCGARYNRQTHWPEDFEVPVCAVFSED